MSDFYILSTSFILWLTSLLIYITKRKEITLAVCIILLYTIIAFSSISLFYNSYSKGYFTEQVYLLPFIYLWGMILLSLLPLFCMEKKKKSIIFLPKIKYVNIICIAVSAFCLLKIVLSIPDLRTSIALLLSGVSDDIIQVYSENTAAGLGKHSAISSGRSIDINGVLTNLSVSLSPLLFFIYMLFPNKNKWIQIALAISLLAAPIDGIIRCSRVLIVVNLFILCFLFIFFRTYLPETLKRRVLLFGTIVIGIAFLFFSIISLGRSHGNTDRNMWNYQRYFSESFLVFDGYCFNAGGDRDGNRTAPLLKVITGEPVLSGKELRYKYRHMSMDSSRFSTFVGDYVLDYGLVAASFIFIVFALIFTRLLQNKKNNEIYFHQFFIVFLVMRFNLGFFQSLDVGLGGNLVFVSLCLLYIFFKKQRQSSKIQIN